MIYLAPYEELRTKKIYVIEPFYNTSIPTLLLGQDCTRIRFEDNSEQIYPESIKDVIDNLLATYHIPSTLLKNYASSMLRSSVQLPIPLTPIDVFLPYKAREVHNKNHSCAGYINLAALNGFKDPYTFTLKNDLEVTHLSTSQYLENKLKDCCTLHIYFLLYVFPNICSEFDSIAIDYSHSLEYLTSISKKNN